jgi:transcriptional regulator with XRE-family HTH domain
MQTYFGSNLKLLREFKILKPERVAYQLGVKLTRYLQWEKGTSHPNSPELYIKICKFFNYNNLLDLFERNLTDADLYIHYSKEI